MNFVQPIRDPERIQQLKEYFKKKAYVITFSSLWVLIQVLESQIF